MTSNRSARPRPVIHRPLFWFVIASALLNLFIFQDALWGRSLLAPLDIAPALFSKYRWMDPQSTGVPRNHYVIDQLTYDLPLQHTIYDAMRRGEMPWWDPYTLCGRPLLADAHVNGTDPIRLTLYAVLPFPLAYNWTRILHFFFTGLGTFVLLRHFRCKEWNCVLWALTAQFGGAHVIWFGHPWIQASFIYYPFLWVLWDRGFEDARPFNIVGASLLVAGVFYSGNVQSHAYILLFAAAILAGYAWRSPAFWKRALPVVAVSGVLGALLAAPVLLNELELYLVSERRVDAPVRLSYLLNLPASLTSFYPWILGTHRTLDLSKVTGQTTLGFHIFVGPLAMLLAGLGTFLKPQVQIRLPVRRVAWLLVSAYILVIVTPLLDYLYTRCAPLALMGIVVLAAFAIEELVATPRILRRAACAVASITIFIAITTHIVAWVVYPRILPRVNQYVEQRASISPRLDHAPALRQFQVKNLPNEISFRNPETVLASLALLGFAAVLAVPNWQGRRGVWIALLFANILPLLLFSQRFIPRHPLAMWEALIAGGPEQERVSRILRGTPARLDDRAASHEQLFVNSMSHLYRVREVEGYSALAPLSAAVLRLDPQTAPKLAVADFVYESASRGLAKGVLSTNQTPGVARFRWEGEVSREMSVRGETLNRIVIRVGPGAPARLVWSDTYFPGWTARSGQRLSLTRYPPCFSVINVPANAREVILEYSPSYLRVGLVLALCGAMVLVLIVWLGRAAIREKRQSTEP